jgi:hypothetical protein
LVNDIQNGNAELRRRFRGIAGLLSPTGLTVHLQGGAVEPQRLRSPPPSTGSAARRSTCISTWTSSTARNCPACASHQAQGPSLTQIEECLAAACATADVTAAGIARAWLPDRVSDQPTREAITRFARALGADLAWQETAAG